MMKISELKYKDTVKTQTPSTVSDVDHMNMSYISISMLTETPEDEKLSSKEASVLPDCTESEADHADVTVNTDATEAVYTYTPLIKKPKGIWDNKPSGPNRYSSSLLKDPSITNHRPWNYPPAKHDIIQRQNPNSKIYSYCNRYFRYLGT